MSFNFASFADTKPASNNSYLKPYSINEDVTIKSTEISEGTNATTGNAWKCLKITFGNNEGTYTESIFYLTDPAKDNARGEMTMSNGGKRELPSNWERTRDKMAAIGYAFFPESFEKFKAVAPTAKTFEEMMRFYINDIELEVTWEDNDSVRALKGIASEGPITIGMSMYGGFGQVGPIGQDLPRNDRQTTTGAGDIVLYSGNQIVVFYGSNSWSYTRLGHIEGKTQEELAGMLGTADVTVTIDNAE
jgi:hypothetical protein